MTDALPPSRIPSPRSAPLERARQDTFDRLQAAFGADELTLAEFDERMELARTASNAPELRVLTEDLPQEGALVLASSRKHSHERAIARTYEGEKVIAFFAEVEREGGWRPPPAMRVLCVGGEVELDFRRAELAPGDVVDVRCRVVGGTVEIEAPKHLNVECAGTSLMGSFSRHSATSTARSGAATLRVHGSALFGHVTLRIDDDDRRRERDDDWDDDD